MIEIFATCDQSEQTSAVWHKAPPQGKEMSEMSARRSFRSSLSFSGQGVRNDERSRSPDSIKVKCLQETRIPGMLIIDSKTPA